MKYVRLPFSGTYNTRISQSEASGPTSGVVGIGVVGQMIVGGTAPSNIKDERYINCMLLSSGSFNGRPRNYLIKRPGFPALNTPAAGSIGTAIMVWTGNAQKVISAFGATNSTIYDSTTSKGAITGRATGITETFVGANVPTLAISSSDSTGWYHDTTTATKITDADFPGNASKVLAGTFAHMDGYAFIMTVDGGLYNSDLNSITAWSSLGFQLCNAYPDKGIGCVRFKNVIVAFGSESMQFFYNAGTAVGSPLQRMDNATLKVGAISQDAIAQMADDIFFVGSTAQGGMSVFQYNGAVNRISTPAEDFRLLIAGPTNISMSTLKCYGRSFVLVRAGGTTHVYCLEDKRWFEWQSILFPWYKCAGLSAGSTILTYSISNTSTAGKIYVVDPGNLVFTDDGQSYLPVFQSAIMDGGTQDIKRWDELRLACDRERTTSNLTVSVSDNDYDSFEDVGTLDLSLPDPKLTRLGASTRRAWRFTHTSPTAFRIEVPQVRIL